jgi:hypothetical protein
VFCDLTNPVCLCLPVDLLLVLFLLSNVRIGNGPYSTVVVGATTGISAALDLTYIDGTAITTGVSGGVQAGVTEQLKLAIVPADSTAKQANGKLITHCYLGSPDVSYYSSCML